MLDLVISIWPLSLLRRFVSHTHTHPCPCHSPSLAFFTQEHGPYRPAPKNSHHCPHVKKMDECGASHHRRVPSATCSLYPFHAQPSPAQLPGRQAALFYCWTAATCTCTMTASSAFQACWPPPKWLSRLTPLSTVHAAAFRAFFLVGQPRSSSSSSPWSSPLLLSGQSLRILLLAVQPFFDRLGYVRNGAHHDRALSSIK